MMKRFIFAVIVLLALMVSYTMAQGHLEPSNGKPLAQYNLAIKLLPDIHRMEVAGTISLPTESSVRELITFGLRSDISDLRIEVLKPDVCAGTTKLRNVGEDKELQATRRWEIKPKSPCPANVPVVLKVAYTGGSETNGRGFFNLSSEGSFANGLITAWYPNFGYHRGTGTLRFTVPKEIVVKATGVLTSKQEIGDQSVYEFTAIKPSVFDFAAGRYTVVRRLEGRVPITLYLFKHHPIEDEMLAGTARIMNLLEKEFGAYPFGEFAIVESPTAASRGAGFLGVGFQGFFLARTDFLERNNFEAWFFGHEMTHQWFPYLVQDIEGEGGSLMMDEALAHYGGLRAVEEITGSAAAERFRRNGSRDALRLMAAGYDYPLGSLPDERAAYSLSNSKGDFIYDMLSRTVGRDKFRAALRNVTSKYAYSALTWKDFLGEIERASGQNLGSFYEQWFNRPGAPTLTLQWSQANGSLKYTIAQGKPVYRLAVPVQIEFSDGTAIMQEAQVRNEKDDVVLKITKPVHIVRLDPHYTVFYATPEQKAEAEALTYFTRGNSQWNFSQTDEALKTFQEGLQHLPEVDAYGVEFLLRLHIGWIHQEANRLDEAKREYELALAQPIRLADYLPRLYLNVAQIAQEQGDRKRVVWAAHNVLTTDRALGPETGRSRQARQLLSK